MEFNNTIPEILVRDVEKSVLFYTEKLGFLVEFTRTADQFYFLSYSGSQLMLQQADEDGWLSHGIDCPLGNGLNIAIKVNSLDNFDMDALGKYIFRPQEEVTYKTKEDETIVRQVIFRDPDGYLIRFIEKYPRVQVI